MEQPQDHIGRDKIKRQINIGQGNYIETQIIYGDRKIARGLTPPPFLSEVFIGREKELAAIYDAFFAKEAAQNDKLLLLVNGRGGVGKTTLASHYYHKYRGAYQHSAWVLSEQSITQALLLLARPLGLDFPPAMGAEARLQELIRQLSMLESPCLLVIDNANDEKDLKAHYRELRRLSNLHLLITSRVSKLEKAEVLRVEGLAVEKAWELFTEYFEETEEGDKALFGHMHQAVNGNTLVIELFAKNLATVNEKPSGKYSLKDLLHDLQSKGLLQLSQSAKVSTDWHQMESAQVEDIIAAMYELSELAREEVAVLSLFAVLPPENILFTDLEKLLGRSDEREEKLLSLSQKGWLDYNKKETSFKCSPVIQEIVRKKNPLLWEDCEGLVHALVEKLDYEGAEGHLPNVESYEEGALWARLGEGVVSCLAEAHSSLSVLTERIGRFFSTTGNLEKTLFYFIASSKIDKALCEKEPDNPDYKNGLAISYQNLGITNASLGNLDKALTSYEEYNRLEKELYSAYPSNVSFKNNLAISYSKLGETHSSLGNLDEALKLFEEYNRLKKELYSAYPSNVSFKNGLAISYSKLGETHSSLGNLDKALKFFEEYNRLEKELYSAYPSNVSFKNSLAISYEKLGETHSSLGNLDEALKFFEEYNRLEKELYSAYPSNVSFKNGLAISYSKLGETHSSLGNLAEALKFFEEYNRLEKELYSAYPSNVSFKNSLAISYSKLGETHSSLGNLDEALNFFEEYNRLEKELCSAYPSNVSFKNSLAISYCKFAELYRDNKEEPGQARSYFQQAEKLWEELVEVAPQYAMFQQNLEAVREALADIDAQ